MASGDGATSRDGWTFAMTAYDSGATSDSKKPKKEGTMTMKRSNPAAEVAAWNARNPVGTRVSVRRDNGTALLSATCSEAWVLGGHTAVVMVDGISGGYLLNRVNPIAGP
jgi:hypothetical protein